jgi:hypothetical protein
VFTSGSALRHPFRKPPVPDCVGRSLKLMGYIQTELLKAMPSVGGAFQ